MKRVIRYLHFLMGGALTLNFALGVLELALQVALDILGSALNLPKHRQISSVVCAADSELVQDAGYSAGIS
jgi:hypothetical protein